MIKCIQNSGFVRQLTNKNKESNADTYLNSVFVRQATN